MKKLTALLLALLLALLAAGCGSDSLDTHIYFNFEPADVAQAEMFRYAGTADGAEKKTVTAEEDIRLLIGMLEQLPLDVSSVEQTVPAGMFSLRFTMQDGGTLEVVYAGYGEGGGRVSLAPDHVPLFTSDGDLGRYWDDLNGTYEAVPAAESELPKFPDGSVPLA